jgi:hypothetical protein
VSGKDSGGLKQGVHPTNQPKELPIGGVTDAVAGDPFSCPNQQFTRDTRRTQVQGEHMRATVRMVLLNPTEEILIQGKPVETSQGRVVQVVVKPRFDLFVILGPQLINDILFHKPNHPTFTRYI